METKIHIYTERNKWERLLVPMLRNRAPSTHVYGGRLVFGGWSYHLAHQAADEIERLRDGGEPTAQTAALKDECRAKGFGIWNAAAWELERLSVSFWNAPPAHAAAIAAGLQAR